MIIDFNRLRTFAMVAHIGSITKAATALHLTQQAVSSQVQLLEQDLGVLLFKRANRRIYLTKEGQQIVASISLHFKAVEHDVLKVVDNMAAMDTRLVIGATNEIADILLADKITDFKVHYPSIRFELLLGDDIKTEQNILDGQLDMGFVVFSKELKLLTVWPFRREQFITVASKKYLAQKKALPIEQFSDLLEHDIIDFESHCPSLQTWLLKNNKKLAAHFEHKSAVIAANDDRMIKRLVLSHLGIANLPKSLVQKALNEGVLEEILPSSEKITAGIDLIMMKHKSESLAAKTFREFVLENN